MNTSLIDLERIPALEELRDFFKSNDWSAAKISDADEYDTETTEAIQYIKKLMDEHFEPLSREKGLPKISACYSKNNPLIALRDNTEDLVASTVVRLLEEQPEAVNEILEKFDFSDPDIDKKADDFLNNAVRTMLDVMDYESAAEVVTKAPAHEDFSNLPNNHAKQNFERDYYKTRSKHPIVSLDELTEGGNESALPNPDFFAINNAENKKEALREFWKTLDADEKQLILLKVDGLTYKEIAEEIGLKTHSAALKRRRKIAEKFTEFYKSFE